MIGAEDLGMVEYRVIVVRAVSRAVLVVPTLEGDRFPRLTVPVAVRRAKALRAIMQELWQADILILDLFPVERERSAYATAELLSAHVPSDLQSVALDRVPSAELSEEERIRIQSSLDGETGSPFTQTGWLSQAMRWLEEATGSYWPSEWKIELHNAGGHFTLARFRHADGCDYWLKATGGPNSHERVVTGLLAQLGGEHLPEIIATREDWNAWIMRADPKGTTDWPLGDCSRLGDVMESMASLQRQTIGFERDLLAAGAFDQRLPRLQQHAGELFAYFCDAMDRQTSTKAPRIEQRRIFEIRDLFERTCSIVERLKIPNTVIHGDMNPGNVVIGEGGVKFIDWSEAYVGNPLITCEHLLLLNDAQTSAVKRFSDEQLRARYRDALGDVCDPGAIDKGFVCIPVLAAASAVYGRGDWFDSPARVDPRRQRYARTLLRYMDRAAGDPELLSVLRS
jgi:hypothetical protein